MPDRTLSPGELVATIKSTISQIRELLLMRPTALSMVTVGPLFGQLQQDLTSLSVASPTPPRQDLLEIQELSNRVQALYRSAASFFGGLSAEAIDNGVWDAAAYSPEGEWAQPAAYSTRLRTEG